MPLNPRRRSLLAAGAAGAAVLLTGCSGDDNAESQRRAERASEANRVRRQAARQSAALLGHYDATAKAHPALADQLAPLRASVARHLTAFGGRLPKDEPTTGAPEAAQDAQSALAALADTERRVAAARTKALDSAPPELARLLASVAAAGAAHAYLLTKDA
ncbi:hypothetical protein [Streptomyces gobiensis]|uniref:hypothetical protein n=1 Tax=Streptomyces gobiensis TaxID=2875706 RepID=UPI001E342EF6|nr:hypothetical protein [Streptomyces gobiensis]UGY93892.1 hypothetical protein test1122_20675 [Streptomyces gobiensis]